MNQFRRLCLPSTRSLSSVEEFAATYSSIISPNTNEADDILDELSVDADAITDNDEDNLLCEINLNANKKRLCRAKAAQDAVLRKTDTSLVKKDAHIYRGTALGYQTLNCRTR